MSLRLLRKNELTLRQNQQNSQPLVSPVHIRLDIRPTLYSEATTSVNEPMLPTHPPAPPPTITGGEVRSNRSKNRFSIRRRK